MNFSVFGFVSFANICLQLSVAGGVGRAGTCHVHAKHPRDGAEFRVGHQHSGGEPRAAAAPPAVPAADGGAGVPAGGHEGGAQVEPLPKFHNHGEGSNFGLLLVESNYYYFHYYFLY